MLQDIKHIGDAVNWNPIKHDLNDTADEDVAEFNVWLKTNYPNIEVDTDDLHGKIRKWKLWKNELGYAKLWNGLMLIAVLTLVVGVLTHFRVGIPSHACWILLWLYGGPVFRSKWLVNHSVHNTSRKVTWSKRHQKGRKGKKTKKASCSRFSHFCFSICMEKIL